MDIITSIAGVLLGGGILAFIQFLINRHDNKHDKFGKLTEAIEKLTNTMEERFNSVDQKIDTVDSKADEYNAVSCRVRILRFEDELQSEIRHSKDAWDQCLSDCRSYETYAETHENFRNNITEATIEHIKRSYAERLEKHDFL